MRDECESRNELKYEIKKALIQKNIDLVGFTSVRDVKDYPPFKVPWDAPLKKPLDVLPTAQSVIVFAKSLPNSKLDVWVRFSEDDEYAALYGKLKDAGYATILLLRSRGYEAKHYRAHFLKYFAYKAGLGCFGKNHLIVTPRFGPRIRLWGVITDANFEPDQPFNEDLCGDCAKCLQVCPVNALTHEGLDRERCWDYISSNRIWIAKDVYTWCSVCIDVCPIGMKVS